MEMSSAVARSPTHSSSHGDQAEQHPDPHRVGQQPEKPAEVLSFGVAESRLLGACDTGGVDGMGVGPRHIRMFARMYVYFKGRQAC